MLRLKVQKKYSFKLFTRNWTTQTRKLPVHTKLAQVSIDRIEELGRTKGNRQQLRIPVVSCNLCAISRVRISHQEMILAIHHVFVDMLYSTIKQDSPYEKCSVVEG